MIGSIALLNVQVQGLGRMLEKEGGEAVRLELERMLLQDQAHLSGWHDADRFSFI
jgi:hypothetical protein